MKNTTIINYRIVTVNNKLFKYANNVLHLCFGSVDGMFHYINCFNNKNTELLMKKWEQLDPMDLSEFE